MTTECNTKNPLGRPDKVRDCWKIQSELTPRANVSLTPENFLILTP